MKKLLLLTLITTLILSACGKTESLEKTDNFIDEELTGEIPFEYEIVETTAENGDYILAPSPWTFRQIFISDPQNVKFIFHPAKMFKKGKGISEVEYLNGEKSNIANSLIIPLKNSTTIEKGSTILTWWQENNASMTKAIIANPSKEIKVYYLNDAFGNEEKTILPSSFSVIEEEKLSPGQTIAISGPSGKKQKGQIIHVDEDNEKILALTSDEFIRPLNYNEFQKINPPTELTTGQTVFAPVAGIYQNVEITEFDLETGLISCKYVWSNEETIENFPITDISATEI